MYVGYFGATLSTSPSLSLPPRPAHSESTFEYLPFQELWAFPRRETQDSVDIFAKSIFVQAEKAKGKYVTCVSGILTHDTGARLRTSPRHAADWIKAYGSPREEAHVIST
ncbi:hypothetical protein N7478_001895 [Penicillium angulare]|uniref:uncharacterized protein n=1 Tax=Penicillium angulare TaxID=116970 RepID=UPI0025414130|nr:uncharacterized protein N7478_001895 [Penicillium angulare]KAJ5288865.1 hypothetical protein N7478_001895 [Penicillium angulare]